MGGAAIGAAYKRHPKTWYVDNSLGSNGNGLTWATAWNSLANIVWASVTGGDTVKISGGSTSQTYSEILQPTKSGTSGRPILITGATDDGHSGAVIIDRANANNPCVLVQSAITNLTIQLLTLQNTNDNCCQIHDTTSGVVIAQYLTIHTGGDGAGSNARGADIRGNSGTVLFQYNNIDTPLNVNAQTDGIFTFSNTSGSVFIQNNVITINNVDPNEHDDCVQIQQDAGTTVRNNFFMHPNGGVNNHGMIINDLVTGSTINIYNNVMVMGQSLGIGIPEVGFFLETLDTGFTGTCNIYNNTVYGGANLCLVFETSFHGTWVVKNNIFYATPISQSVYSILGATLVTINNNTVWAQSGNLRLSLQTSGGPCMCRSTTSQTSAKVYWEAQLGFSIGSGNTLIGFANSTQALNTFVGASGNNSCGYLWQSGAVYQNGGHATDIFTSKACDVLAFAVDFTAKKLWIKNLTTNTGWNNDVIGNQNPATGTGGISTSGITGAAWFIATSIGGIGDYVVLNAGGQAFFGTVPVGFAAWGASTTFNPSDIQSPATLTGCITDNGGSFLTWAQWQTAGNDVNGVNADPLFVSNGVDFHLQQSSPAGNVGTNLHSIIAYDKDGNARPASAAFDDGAYEIV